MLTVKDANSMLADLYQVDGEPCYRLVKYHGKTKLMYSRNVSDKPEQLAYIYSQRLTDDEAIQMLLGYVVRHQWTLANPL